jgi:hypothetical protein
VRGSSSSPRQGPTVSTYDDCVETIWLNAIHEMMVQSRDFSAMTRTTIKWLLAPFSLAARSNRSTPSIYEGCSARLNVRAMTSILRWHLFILHNFAVNHIDGFSPATGVVLGKFNTLYGTTSLGGSKKGDGDHGGGTLFKIVLQTSISDGSVP